MNNPACSIHPSLPKDALPAISLIRLSMGNEADWLFGMEKGHPTDIVLASLFRKRKNRLSHDSCWLTKMGEKVVGLLLAYPGRRIRQRDLVTGWQLLGIFGLPATIRLAMRQPLYGNLREAEADEFYISNLAVPAEMQGRGIGKSLLSFAEEQATAAGFSKCSLIVTFDNPAIQIYEHCGYRICRSFSIPHQVIAHGSGGYHRMVKVLKDNPKGEAG